MPVVKNALLSVSNKTGIVEFAHKLRLLGVDILSTGGTAKLLTEAGIEVREVADYTGFPEMMDGRVKTLHPRVLGGILGRRGTDDNIMAEHSILAIDLVVVNLYPFAETITKQDCSLATAIENIDIGGPTMVRAAAKNYNSVAVVVNPNDYNDLLTELEQNSGSVSDEMRFTLSVKAFEHTASYDGAIANYLGTITTTATKDSQQNYPRTFNIQYTKVQDMRYGENPHQTAAFYREAFPADNTVSSAQQIQGKALSFNNIADTDAALECVKQFAEPACVIVKHANPCGVATSNTQLEAYKKAYQTDPTSAFGGIIAFNCRLDNATAAAIIERQFVEVIIAPAISQQAAQTIAQKKNIRLLVTHENAAIPGHITALDYKKVTGGLLVQEQDNGMVNIDDLKIVSHIKPSQQQLEDMLFAWKVAKYVKSNAIVYAKSKQTIGIGAGQMSRVYSAKIAGIKALDEGLDITDSVMASDAFFPFRDGIDAAAAANIKAIIQPGGSMRDEEVISAANEHKIAMVFTNMRHFRH